jgi:phosphoketolase
MKRLFTQYSFPGGVPSHAAPEVLGSINEGGELGYSLLHAYGAVFDNPDLVACCVVGDGEAETGPLAAGWHWNKFLNPARDGAVLPILHLNGYKIAGPTILARIGQEELLALFRGYGYEPRLVAGNDPAAMQGRGHHDDTLRHDRAQRPRPLPPRPRGDRPRAAPRRCRRARQVKQRLRDKLVEHRLYIAQHGDDMPEIKNWRWPQERGR